LIQAALNGARAPGEHPALPLTPEALEADARAVVAAGAGSLHFHPRDADGLETLEAGPIAAALRAVRPVGAEISLSTGLWITGGDVERRLALIEGWTERPDLASVNLAEPGWEELADLLTSRRIGVEAGLNLPEHAEALLASGMKPARILVEIDDDGASGEQAVAAAAAVDAVLDAAGSWTRRLHHGMGPATWAVIAAAKARGHDVRIGLEDVLTLPDGSVASGNVALFEAALR
jgi:uncharacterized protein (DUF849 family)